MPFKGKTVTIVITGVFVIRERIQDSKQLLHPTSPFWQSLFIIELCRIYSIFKGMWLEKYCRASMLHKPFKVHVSILWAQSFTERHGYREVQNNCHIFKNCDKLRKIVIKVPLKFMIPNILHTMHFLYTIQIKFTYKHKLFYHLFKLSQF